MTYDQLQKANDTIKTTDIKGKDYAEVNERIRVFRMLCPNGSITTEIQSLENGVCVMKATVCNDEGAVIGTGTAYEKEGSTFINKASYIENCETSAVGRALGMCGIGINSSVASYEEVANAINNQANKAADKKQSAQAQPTQGSQVEYVLEPDVKRLVKMLKEKGITQKSVCEQFGISSLRKLTVEQYEIVCNSIAG